MGIAFDFSPPQLFCKPIFDADVNFRCLSLTILTLLGLLTGSHAQHLWWNLDKEREGTCLYGEITVLATHPSVYYCGANWHPGEPAGGYCGIQDNSPTERCTIFSIWDTSAMLHPEVIQADKQTIFHRFGGEGTGSHTHMPWHWEVGRTFQFFVRKQPENNAGATDIRYYMYDSIGMNWRHIATIASPNGGEKSVTTIGGGLNSFLENYTGKSPEVPRLALYRLWVGRSPDTMKCLTHAQGDGIWGELKDAYFLATGDPARLNACFSGLELDYGKPLLGGKDKPLPPISDKPMPPGVTSEIARAPDAPGVDGRR